MKFRSHHFSLIVNLLISAILIGLLYSCNTNRIPYYDKKVKNWETNALPAQKPEHTFYLVGNVGNTRLNERIPPALSLLKQDWQNGHLEGLKAVRR